MKKLREKRAKIVVLAHQGRKGDPDFISLRQHAEFLDSFLGHVKFIDDIFGERAQRAIRELAPGDILVLENVRFWDGETKKGSAEEHSKTVLVQNLAPLIDVFIIDAFAAAHRPHVSLIGFAPVVKDVVAGKVMEEELRALIKVREKPDHPCIYILGGAKAEDSAEIVDVVLSKGIADYILTGGLVANLFLKASGFNLGKINEEVLGKKGFMDLIPRIQNLLKKFDEKIVLPMDLAVDINGTRKEIRVKELPVNYLIKDVGSETTSRYSDLIRESRTIVMNGPLGIFEEKGFERATHSVFTAMSKSKAFTLIGGGHTIAAASHLNFIDKFSHISTGGGALIEYLVKGTLPVIEVLKKFGGVN